MLELLLKIGLAILMVIGLTEVFRGLCGWLFKTRLKGKIVYVLPVSGHEEEAEMALRGAIHRLQWVPGKEEIHILCVNSGMDEETEAVCRKTAEHCRAVSICEKEELAEKMEQLFANP